MDRSRMDLDRDDRSRVMGSEVVELTATYQLYPFCGGGTTAVAALGLDRQWLCYEIEEESVHISRDRIKQALEAKHVA